jgi:hypothetical protein
MRQGIICIAVKASQLEVSFTRDLNTGLFNILPLFTNAYERTLSV